MRKLTDKQTNYIDNRVAGMKQREAAVAAGYLPGAAAVTASQMEAKPAIKAAIAAGRKAAHKPVDEIECDPRYKLPKAHYDDAKEFLTDAMNHKYIPITARADYAKALLPYQHARVGEEGKKAKAKSKADELTGGKGKFQPKQPPKLTVVGR